MTQKCTTCQAAHRLDRIKSENSRISAPSTVAAAASAAAAAAAAAGSGGHAKVVCGDLSLTESNGSLLL